MQGYDAVAMQADVQVGGTDQLFNIVVAGRKLQQSLGQKPQVGVVLGILPGTDGKQRMSKTTGNHIPIVSTPDDMYGKVMSIPDSAMGAYWRLATRYSPDRVRLIEEGLGNGEIHPRDAKMELAGEITDIFWGSDESKSAARNFSEIYQKGSNPAEMEEVGVAVGDVLVDIIIRCGFATSRSEARRLIREGGLRIDGRKVMDEDDRIAPSQDGVVIQKGKRRFARLVRKDKHI